MGHHIGGIIVNYQDGPEFISEMVAAVEKLLENKKEWSQLAHSARERAMKNYQWNLIADDWIKFLKITSFENSQV